jgi:hypothetical protein
VFVEDGMLHYSSMSDIFCQGLGRDALERLIQHNVGKAQRDLATTGNHLDPEDAEYLQQKYPKEFRLHFSVMTYSTELRDKLFTRTASPETILKLTSVLRAPKMYLCNFDAKQTIEDIQTLDAHAQPGVRLQIARMHCTSMHTGEIRELARQSAYGYGEVADWLKTNLPRLRNIDEVHFQAPPEGYTWTFRNALRKSVEPLQLGSSDVVVTSPAAADILRHHAIPPEAEVIPVFDSLGATTSFTTTIATENILGTLRELRDRRDFRRVVLPSSIYWVQDRYSVDGKSVDDIKAAFSDVEITLVDVPHEIRRARLSIDECLDYYTANPGASTLGDHRAY